MLDFNNLQNYRENNRIEAKQATGGLPESIWETYSAFANTQGGVILLGVEELADKSLHAIDLLDPQWIIEDLWTGLEDPKVVSRNILTPDDVEIHVVGCEVPLLDGSAKLIVEALDKAGIAELDAPRRMMRVAREFALEQNGKAIAVKPYDGFRVDYTIRFPHPVIGEQRFVLDISPETFRTEIANARTFGFFREAEYLRSRGLARGCSLDNVIVIDDNGVMNEGGLRFPDEFVRHKILDFIGDMAMLGKPMLGDFTVSCSGHAHNNAFLRQLSQLEGALEAVER